MWPKNSSVFISSLNCLVVLNYSRCGKGWGPVFFQGITWGERVWHREREKKTSACVIPECVSTCHSVVQHETEQQKFWEMGERKSGKEKWCWWLTYMFLFRKCHVTVCPGRGGGVACYVFVVLSGVCHPIHWATWEWLELPSPHFTLMTSMAGVQIPQRTISQPCKAFRFVNAIKEEGMC